MNRHPLPSDDDSSRTETFLRHYTDCETQLRGYLLSLLSNQSDTDEAFQETILVLWRRFDEFDPDGSFFAWAKGIAFHKALHLRQKRSRCKVEDHAFLEAVDAMIDRNVEGQRMQIQMLKQCLEKLADADRKLVNVRYGTDRRIVDYAEEVGKPANTVYKALERIRRMLIQCVERNLAAEGRR
ncbi:sigma-70 family RNA polymerase sigma factor [Aeoliella sp.]|uniref:sigma-70 family RNA polymerase sigma factor n=1 Tax=Aeoliella sp. TaxID=2795800 RepID=UPI003CCB7E67